MKRLLLLMILSCFTVVGFAQDVYYWAGGATSTSLTGTNWKKDNTGSNVARSAATDILVFDGVTVDFTVSSVAAGKLQLQNGANIGFVRNSNAGTSTFTLNGVGSEALNLSGSSKLRLVDGTGGNFVLSIGANTTNLVNNSEVYLQGAAWTSTNNGAQRIAVPSTSTLTFSNSSKCFVNVVNQYPFSNTSTSGVKSVIFNSGTSLIYQGGRSPFGDNSTGYVVDMKSGSSFILEANNITNANVIINGLFSGKKFGNVIVRNNATINADNFLDIESLEIQNGASFLLSTGASIMSGNILNNGTLGRTVDPSSSNLLMSGLTQQTISGNGIFDLGVISVSALSNLKVESNLAFNGSSTGVISGKIDLGTRSISGIGSIQFRSSSFPTTSATLTQGSTVISLDPAKYFSDGLPNGNSVNLANAALGASVTGTGIPSNTVVVATSSTTSSITLSNPVTLNASNLSGSITMGNAPATLAISNASGIDGAITLAGDKTFGAETNYVFNAITSAPFSSSNGNALGDVTFNAAATTNRNLTVNGKITLNNAKLTVREGDLVTLAPTTTFAGSLGSSSYIATAANSATGTFGKLRLTDLSTSTLIPVGTTTHYTPVTLNPTSTSTFDINVFAGTTTDATPNGTALTVAQKSRMVDATWNINRTSGTGNVGVTLGWDNAVEGTDFSGFGNSQIGIASYTGGTYTAFTGSGDVALNTATITTSSFAPFVVGEANTTLPLTLISFTPKQVLNTVKLEWRTTDEVNLKNYVLQHKTSNGFEDIYTVAANNKLGIFNYNYTHLNPVAGVNYYRLVGVDLNGTTHESDVKPIRVTLGNEVAVYPNPVSQKNITVSGVVKGDVIKIFNIQGQVIATKTTTGNQVEEIDVQNIQAGTYILSIENSGKVTNTKKVIKI